MRPLVFSCRFVLGILLATIALGQTTDSRTSRDVLEKYKKDLEANPRSSLAHYRIAEILVQQRNLQSAANEFREAVNGDLQPAWTEAWAHINLGMIFDVTVQRDRAINEYRQAQRIVARKKIEHLGRVLDQAAKCLKSPCTWEDVTEMERP